MLVRLISRGRSPFPHRSDSGKLSCSRHVRKCWTYFNSLGKKIDQAVVFKTFKTYYFAAFFRLLKRSRGKRENFLLLLQWMFRHLVQYLWKHMTSPSLPRKSGAILKTLSGRGSRLFPLPIVPRAPVFSLQRSRSRSRFFRWCLLTGASAEERGSFA